MSSQGGFNSLNYYSTSIISLAYLGEPTEKHRQRDFKKQTQHEGDKAQKHMLFTNPCQVTLLLPEKCLLSFSPIIWGKVLGKQIHEIHEYKFTQTNENRRDEKHNLFSGIRCCAALKLWRMRDKVGRGLLKVLCDGSAYL